MSAPNLLSHGDATASDCMTAIEEALVDRMRREYTLFAKARYPLARHWAEVQVDRLPAAVTFDSVEDLTLFLTRRYREQPSARKDAYETLMLRDIAHDLWSLAELLHQSFTKPRPVAGWLGGRPA